jgi:hypothetical protein
MLGVLKLESAVESENAAVLFVAPHEALAVFVASWIGKRLGKYTRVKMLRRLWVLFLPFDQGVRGASLSDDGRILFKQPSADKKPKEFRMVVVDEGHHIYKNAALRETVEIVDVEDVPLAYLPGNATRVRVKAVGELHV